MNMEFAILTTTHKRPELLLQSVLSVQNQSYKKFKHYIVNDSPDFDYSLLEKELKGYSNIFYIKNSENIGKNKSLNAVLDILERENFKGSIVYLDDDDMLAKETLDTFSKQIKISSDYFWFVSNRVLGGGESLTKNKTKQSVINYFWQYLFLKKFTGDATHCIDFEKVRKIRFPRDIKNGEEWIYFYSVSKILKRFYYINTPGTISTGYLAEGITKNYKNQKLQTVLTEVSKANTLDIKIFIYIVLKKIKNLISI